MQQVGRKVRAMREKGTTELDGGVRGGRRTGGGDLTGSANAPSLARGGRWGGGGGGGGGSGEEFRVNKVREACHAIESKRGYFSLDELS